MSPRIWPCPLPGGGTMAEMALEIAPPPGTPPRGERVLVVPALLDEGHRLRHFTVGLMRRLAQAGLTSWLIDLPGTNESPAQLLYQTPGDWQLAAQGAALHFGCTHVLALRGGALVAPRGLPTWHYAPVAGGTLLRRLVRARVLSAREKGREESETTLLDHGRDHGLELAGYDLGADFLREFTALVPEDGEHILHIGQDMLGGPGLWMRAEPGEAPEQSDLLAAVLLSALRAQDAA